MRKDNPNKRKAKPYNIHAIEPKKLKTDGKELAQDLKSDSDHMELAAGYNVSGSDDHGMEVSKEHQYSTRLARDLRSDSDSGSDVDQEVASISANLEATLNLNHTKKEEKQPDTPTQRPDTPTPGGPSNPPRFSAASPIRAATFKGAATSLLAATLLRAATPLREEEATAISVSPANASTRAETPQGLTLFFKKRTAPPLQKGPVPTLRLLTTFAE